MLKAIDDFVWGVPLIVLILAVGIFLTIRLRGLQITKLSLAIKHMLANEKNGEHGEVSSFGALCTALSATIGTGNIVGVATALVEDRFITSKTEWARNGNGLQRFLHFLVLVWGYLESELSHRLTESRVL